MAKVIIDPQGYRFMCPGCNETHIFSALWTFNGDFENPTVQPSILVTGVKGFDDPTPRICHSYITDGAIAFLSDSSHDLAGTTAHLPDID